MAAGDRRRGFLPELRERRLRLMQRLAAEPKKI